MRRILPIFALIFTSTANASDVIEISVREMINTASATNTINSVEEIHSSVEECIASSKGAIVGWQRLWDGRENAREFLSNIRAIRYECWEGGGSNWHLDSARYWENPLYPKRFSQ